MDQEPDHLQQADANRLTPDSENCKNEKAAQRTAFFFILSCGDKPLKPNLARVILNHQVRLHHYRIRHIRQDGYAVEANLELSVIDIKIIRRIAL